jgi:carbamoyl-phosphate synthase large subunit
MKTKQYRILTEASGSLTAGYLIKAIKSAGHISVCSDINTGNAAEYLADEFIVVPNSHDENLWSKISEIVLENQIDIVIPSFDETLI